MFFMCVVLRIGILSRSKRKKKRDAVLKARAGEEGNGRRNFWPLLENHVAFLYSLCQWRVFQYLFSVIVFPKTKSCNS